MEAAPWSWVIFAGSWNFMSSLKFRLAASTGREKPAASRPASTAEVNVFFSFMEIHLNC